MNCRPINQSCKTLGNRLPALRLQRCFIDLVKDLGSGFYGSGLSVSGRLQVAG